MVVLVGVEHDGGVRQYIDSIWVLEDLAALPMVVLAEGLHDAIDLLSFARQPEGLQVHADGGVKGQACICISRVSLGMSMYRCRCSHRRLVTVLIPAS